MHNLYRQDSLAAGKAFENESSRQTIMPMNWWLEYWRPYHLCSKSFTSLFAYERKSSDCEEIYFLYVLTFKKIYCNVCRFKTCVYFSNNYNEPSNSSLRK